VVRAPEPHHLEGERFLAEIVWCACDASGFSVGLINPNDPVNSVDFCQTTVNLGNHLENITNNP
jgi:hypothetical protein